MRKFRRLRFGIVAGVLSAVAGLNVTARESVPPSAPDIGARPPITEEPSALPTVLIVPGSFSAERVADGCWVQFYTGDRFTGIQLNIVGPVEMRTMKGPFGARWTGLESVIVGPRAQVTAFDDEDFEDHSLSFEPGQQIPDLGERRGRSGLGIFEDIKSLRVTCLPRR
jgi:hypothetical protein